MDNKEIFAHIDHTILNPEATCAQIEQVAAEAQEYGAASLCVAPCHVRRIRQLYPKLRLTTVIGFPLGYSTSGTKVFEAAQAVEHGADEIDMVINIGAVKDGRYHCVLEEISQVKKTIDKHILKVIVETCYLTDDEKRELAPIVQAGGADYIKTSTGRAPAGATLADVELLRELLSGCVLIKAAGGIRTKQQMLDFLAAGAERLGCSTGVTALFGAEEI